MPSSSSGPNHGTCGNASASTWEGTYIIDTITYLTCQPETIVIQKGAKANLSVSHNTLVKPKDASNSKTPQLSASPVCNREPVLCFPESFASISCVFVELPEHMASLHLPPCIEHNIYDACFTENRVYPLHHGLSAHAMVKSPDLSIYTRSSSPLPPKPSATWHAPSVSRP